MSKTPKDPADDNGNNEDLNQEKPDYLNPKKRELSQEEKDYYKALMKQRPNTAEEAIRQARKEEREQQSKTNVVINPNWAQYTLFPTNIGILGGSFNPIHNGHLMIADAVLKHLDLDQIMFMPASAPPHKTTVNKLNAGHRYEMCKLALIDNPYFTLSDIEIRRFGTTYTIDTLIELRQLYGNETNFYYIIGADTLLTLQSWKNFEKVLGMCTFIVVSRPGYKTEELVYTLNEFKARYDVTMYYLEMTGLDISSSKIQNLIMQDESIRYLVPDSVNNYILKWSVYKKPALNNMQVVSKLKKSISLARYKHTVGVAETAIKLADKHGVNRSKAFRAALLHDCAKEIPFDEMISKCSDYNVILDETMIFQPSLIHGPLGVEIAKNVYHEYDYEILTAIKFHTTGRAKMTNLEIIIYLADYIEPNRGDSEFLRAVRYYVYHDIYKALLMCIDKSIEEVESSGRVVHHLTYRARKYYRTWQNDFVLVVKNKKRKQAIADRAAKRKAETKKRNELKALEKKKQKAEEKRIKALIKEGVLPASYLEDIKKTNLSNPSNVSNADTSNKALSEENLKDISNNSNNIDTGKTETPVALKKKAPEKFTKSTALKMGETPNITMSSLTSKPFDIITGTIKEDNKTVKDDNKTIKDDKEIIKKDKEIIKDNNKIIKEDDNNNEKK